jgi:hypothetical protein
MIFHGGNDVLLQGVEEKKVRDRPEADVLADDGIAVALLHGGGVDGYASN